MTEVVPTITIKLTKAGPLVKLRHFEYLTPVKIEKCFEAATKEWYRLRAASIHERRKREHQEKAELAGAENA